MTPLHRILDGLAALWANLTAVDGNLAAACEAMETPPIMGDTHSRKVDPEYERITAELRAIQRDRQWTTCSRRARVLPNRATSDPLAANLLIAATGNGTVRIVEEETA